MKWSNAFVIVMLTGMSMITYSFVAEQNRRIRNNDTAKIINTFIQIRAQDKLNDGRWATISVGNSNIYNLNDYQTAQLNRLLKASNTYTRKTK